jgi:hypothetical protein
VRRSIAAGAALIVVILLFLGLRSCLDARKERAYKDYVRDVQALVGESDQLADQMFGQLSDPGDAGEVDIQNLFNQYRNANAQLVERARSTEHPDELDQAHRYVIETLEFRESGVSRIADLLPSALAEQDRREGTESIAAEMQKFLASDVIFSQRVIPTLQAALEEEDLTGEGKVPTSQFLPDIDWLQPTTVSDRISRIRSGGDSGPAAPGLHGNGLGTVALGGVALTPGGTATVTLSDDLAFDVQVANQGDNTETDVTVRVAVGDDIEVEEQLDTIAAGETKNVAVPLAEQPPTGEALPVTVEIEPVPGEEKTDNNVGEFNVIFSR